MSVIQGNARGGSAYQIPRSLRFRSSASAYLSRTFSGAPTLGTKQTISIWTKRGALGAALAILAAGYDGSSSNAFYIGFANDKLEVQFGGAAANAVTTSAVYRDPSAHLHIVLSIDTTQTTAANRVVLYVNGSQITAFSSATYPAQNAVCQFGIATVNNKIGAAYTGTNYWYDGYLSEVNFIDGQALTPTSFGETSATTGQWTAKRYTGTYGTNGFYLPFSDTTSTTTLCYDASGNGNNWTPNNISLTAGVTYDSMTDVPLGGGGSLGNGQGNYATLSSIDTSRTLSAGNLQYAGAATGIAKGTQAVSSGKWYWEYQYNGGATGGVMGIAKADLLPASSWLGQTSSGYGYFGGTGSKYNGSGGVAYGASWTTTDILGVALDLDAGTLTFYKNNVSQGVAFSGLSGFFVPAAGNSTTDDSGIFNFGQRPFAHTPPTGFKALHTGNLPAPAITKPKNHFDVITDTGANIKAAVEALYSDQALMVVKDRANANNWQWFNDVTGLNAILQSNTTSAETTYSTPSGSSVGYGWKAGNGTVSNTQGTITSTVSANPAAGLSIATFQAPASVAAFTVGHGLGVTPAMVIRMSRSQPSARPHLVYHKNQAATPQNNYLFLNTTAASTADSTMFNNTAPTSAVVTYGTYFAANETFVQYSFSEIAGYSKFGLYQGNGLADGPFVFCGFRPRWVVIKRTDAVGNWNDFDTSRNTANPANNLLLLNTADAEVAGGPIVDFTSNGFKLRDNSANWNTSGGTYIFAAFAESPFQSALAR